MKSTKIIRRLDRLGRIVLPKDVREIIGVNNDESIEITITERGVFLKKHITETYLLTKLEELSALVNSLSSDLGLLKTREALKYIEELRKILDIENT